MKKSNIQAFRKQDPLSDGMMNIVTEVNDIQQSQLWLLKDTFAESRLFGEFLWDENKMDLARFFSRRYWADNYPAIIEAMKKAGTYESIIVVVESALGVGKVLFESPTPSHLIVYIAPGIKPQNWIAVGANQELDRVVYADGNGTGGMIFADAISAITFSETKKLIELLTVCGIYTEVLPADPPPTVVTPPPSTLEAAEGQTMTITATASDAESWEWFKDGVTTGVVGTGNGATYTKTPVTSSDVGAYFCRFSSPFGEVDTSVCTVTVITLPGIVAHPPASIAITEGQPLNITATGSGASGWQWFKDGAATMQQGSGNDAVYYVELSTPADSGSYFCRFSNAAGHVDSGSCAASVASTQPPVITAQPPANINVTENNPFEIRATATGSDSWQWFKDGGPFGGAGAGNDAVISFGAAAMTDAGSYYVNFSNVNGTTTSSASVVAVAPALQPPVVVDQPDDVTVTEGYQFSMSATATAAEGWDWYHNGSYTGASGAGEVAAFASDYATPAMAGQYYCHFYNTAGSVDSGIANVTVLPPPTPPVIIQQPPTSLTVAAGQQLTLTATAENANSWSWWRDTMPMGDGVGNNASLSKVADTSDDNPFWHCRFFGGGFSTNTNYCDVTVTTGPVITDQPDDATVPNGSPFTITAVATGNPSWYWYFNGSYNGVNGSGDVATFSATASPSTAGGYHCEFENAGGEVFTRVATITVV